ncbi:MAG TPA: 16S rRNA (cytidine(1402)-2'-O)-methyltransferase [Candidatus Binatia bacterium]|nr:16S rRNA (cytidine(1402)-2'-O)-methyltransferase [Candidatus Binatia bacterium]
MAGVLYIVATPIGNLEDITLRALRILKEVHLIAAEDTRHARILLARYEIQTPLTSYHEHNERAKARPLVERLERGEPIALIADAGTPAISDPGYRLVAEAIRAGIRVIPIPGPSALAAALSASGLPTDRFAFEGFLPAKKPQRKGKLKDLARDPRTLVFYEAPHRLKDSLVDMLEILGDRPIAIGREITKIHEEFLRGRVSEVLAQLADRDVKGEITLIVHGGAAGVAIAQEEIGAQAQRLIDQGMGVKDVSELLSERYGISKREIYRIALKHKDRKQG